MNRNVWIVACMCTLVFGQTFGMVEEFLDDYNVSYKKVCEQNLIELVYFKLGGRFGDLPVYVFSPKKGVLAIRVPNGYPNYFNKSDELRDAVRNSISWIFRDSSRLEDLAKHLFEAKIKKISQEKMVKKDFFLDQAKDNFSRFELSYYCRNLYGAKRSKDDPVGTFDEMPKIGYHQMYNMIGKVDDPNSKFDGFMYIVYTRIGSKSRGDFDIFEHEKEFLRRLHDVFSRVKIRKKVAPPPPGRGQMKFPVKKKGSGFMDWLSRRFGSGASGYE